MKKLLLHSKTLTYTFLLLSIFFANSVFSQTNTWDGSSSSNWGTSGNWSLNHVPTATEDVVIPNGANNAPISINVAAVCKSFTMTGGSTPDTVNFSGTNSLTVSGAVTINAGTGNGDNKILNVAAGSLTCTSITVATTSNTNRNSRITVSTGTVTVTGNVNMSTTNTNNAFTFSGAGLLKVGGDMSGGTFTASTSTVQYYGDGTGGTSATQSIEGYTYNNLSTLGSGTKTLAASATIGGNLNIATGTTLNLDTFTANRSAAGGTLTIAGTLRLGATTGGQTGSNFPTNFSTLTLTGGTVDYNNATGGQTIYNTPTYNVLTLSNTSGTQTAGGNLTTTTLNTSSGGSLNMSTFTLAVTNVTNNGTIRTQNTSATPIPAGKSWGGTVQFDGAGQTVPGSSTSFTNLIYGGSGTKTLTGGAISISGDFSINTGVVANLGTFTSSALTLTLGGTSQVGGQYGGTSSGATFINTTFFATATGKLNVACFSSGLWTGATSTNWATASNWCSGVVPTASTNVVINSGGNQPVINAAAVCNNITLGSGATLTINSSLDVAGNWTNNGGTIAGSGTVTLSGTATIAGSSATTFPNLTATGTITQGINTNVSGNFSQTAGTYNVASGTSNYTLAVTGNFNVNGGTFNVSNGANNSSVTVGGTFDFASGSVILISNGSSTGATITVTGDVSVSGTAILNFELISATNGVAVFNANANVSLTGTGTDYVDFGTGTATNNAFNIKGNFSKSGTGNIYVTSTGAVKGFVFNGTGTSGSPQTLSYAGTSSTYHDYTVNTGTYVKLLTSVALGTATNPASTFTINGTLDAQTFVISGSSTAGVKLNSGATLITANTGGVTATITATTPTYNAAANYVFNGAANQNTSFSNATMNNLTIANTGTTGSNTVTINTAAPTVNGALTVSSGILNAAAFQIIGNATNAFSLASGTSFRLSGGYPTLFTTANTTFNAASTVEYYGATQTVSSTPTYGNLTITTAGTKTAGGAITAAGVFTINTGATFAASTFTHNIAGNWVNNGIFTANTSTITLNGGAQSITGVATTFNNLTLATSSSTKTFGLATTISSNLTINTGVKADLGTFKSTSATLTLGGAAQGTGTSYGGTGSPAANVNSTFFVANSGYLNVGTCGTYSITSIAAAAAACIGNSATINVTSTVGNLPDGTYTVFYTLGAPNAISTTATMTVSGGTGTGSFITTALANTGTTSITIDYIRNGCVSAISAGNTATITVNPNNTAGTASSTPTLCINTALTNITHTTTGATGIGTATGLPAGVTAAWASNIITISGTPTASGTFSYSIPLTGGCGSVNATGTITVTPANTAGTASSTPTLCINTALTNITHATTGATGIGTATGLPAGVNAAWASNIITISGTPTASGTFSYSIPLTGGCGSVNATGTITVTPANTAGAASSTPTLCINTALTNITHATTGATGIGTATGLPAGVSAAWASNIITISGTPTASGTFSYSIPLTGGCGSATATGTITVTPANTAGTASSTPTLCINTALTNITHATTGATGIGTATGLPAGVTAAWASNTITISGTPTASGTFSYSIPLTGGCGSVNATGTITVTPANTAGAASSTPTLCINTALTNITHATTGATGIGTATGLPAGVSAAWASNTITISGTPTASGTFSYSIPLTGGCGSVNATGAITVTPANTAGAASSTPTLCINTALTNITHTTTGATGIGTATGLPAGVTAAWASNTITISGTPTASGTFSYSIPLTGGCGSVNATGSITVDPASVGGTVSAAQTICYGTEPADLTLTGETGSIVKWQSSSDAAFTSPTDITETSNTLDGATIGALTSDTYFRAVVQSGSCAASYSVAALITVDALTVGGTVSSNQTICSGTQPADLTVSGHTGSVIKWESSLDAAFTSPTDLFITSTTLTGTAIGALTQDTYFRAVVQNGACSVEESAPVLITVNDTTVGGSISGATGVCSGSTSGLLTLSGYTGSIVRWEYSVSPFSSWTTIANTTSTYTSGTLTQTTQFRAVVQSGVCSEVNSSPITVTISSTTWTSGAWTNGTPDATKAAIISDSFISAGTNITACSLTVNNGASVVISSGDTVTLSGALISIPGTLVTINNNANLIQSGTTNTNSGAIIIKRNSSALKRQDYTIWSSPVASQQLQSFSPQTLSGRFYTYNTTTNLYDVVASPSTTNFDAAKGYLIRMPNNHPATATIWAGQFAGVPNNGNYSFTLVNGGAGQRFNLVGNPYPSPIDATAFIGDSNNTSSITGALYFWRKTNNALSPTYCTWTLGGFVSNGEAQVFDPNDVIQTGQGFFVEGTGSGTVNFNNSMRINNHANQFFKNATANVTNTTTIERNRVWLNATNASGLFSQAMVGYITNATQGVDNTIDGKYINDGDIALTSLIDTTPYAIQARALPFDANDVVPMQFKVTTAGEYTIAIDHKDGLFADSQEVYLRDNLTGQIHNLNTGSYTFASESGTFTSRFELLYQIPLGYTQPTFNTNQVVVYKSNTDEIVVNTGTVVMSSVKVFDIRGRLLEEKTAINASQTTVKGGAANEVLLVQVTSQDGITIIKKVIR